MATAKKKKKAKATKIPVKASVFPVPATTGGKEIALKALAYRRENKPEKIDNGSLYAGSPMYYYCHTCGHLSDCLPETHWGAPSHICSECQALKNLGWLE
jgi:hypothetical protein